MGCQIMSLTKGKLLFVLSVWGVIMLVSQIKKNVLVIYNCYIMFLQSLLKCFCLLQPTQILNFYI